MADPVDPLDPLARLVRPDQKRPDQARPDAEPPRARTPAPPMEADPLAYGDGDDLYDGGEAAPAVPADVELTAEDRDLLVALAAFQLRYGEDAEALAYLLAARLVFPDDADVLRLLAHALVKVGRTEEADEALAALDRIVRPAPPLALLSRALVRLAQGRVAEARRLFAQYRERGVEDDYDRAA